MWRRTHIVCLGFLLAAIPADSRHADGAELPDGAVLAGVARIDITPDYPVRLAGYAGRMEEATEVVQRLWGKAYANGMPCYISSKRLLDEGGYEVDSSMISYGQPARLAREAEDTIITAVRDLVRTE